MNIIYIPVLVLIGKKNLNSIDYFSLNVDLISAIKVWDLRYTYSRLNPNHTPKPKRMFCVPIDDVKSINRLAGFSDMKMDSNRTTLFANCTNSKIYQFDLHENAYLSSSKIQSYTGHRVGSFNVKVAISPHDQLLLTGSSDFYSYIYRVKIFP
jgi:denticleless